MKIHSFIFFAYCFLLFIFAPYPTHAQGWDMTFGDPGISEYIYSAKELSDSSVAFFGYTRVWGTADFTFFLSKVDQHGNLVWHQNYGDVFYRDEFLDFDTLSNGQFYLAGSELLNGQRGHRTLILDEMGDIVDNNFSSFEEPMGNSSFVRGIKKDDNDEVWVIGKQLGDRLLFRKYGLQGELLWENTNTELYNANFTRFFHPAIPTSDEGLVFLLEVADEDQNENFQLAKIVEGQGVVWNVDFGYAHRVKPKVMVPTPDQGTLILNERHFYIDTITPNQYQSVTKDYLTKISPDGSIIWEYPLDSVGNTTEAFGDPIVLPNGEIFMATQYNSRYKTYRFAADGELLEETLAFHPEANMTPFAPKAIVSGDGRRLLAFKNYDQNLQFYYFDESQNLLWEIETNLLGQEDSYGLRQTLDESFLLYGSFMPEGQSNNDALVLKLDSLGQINIHHLHGTVFFDIEENCQYDTVDIRLPNWIVNITGTPDKYAVTDTAGVYDTTVDNDTLTVTAEPISPYWELCPDISPISFPDGIYSLTVDVPMEATIDCPYMVVDVSTPLLRPCQETSYYINYCNWGTVAEDSAWVEISFDENIHVETASIPWDSQTDNTFTFSLGEVSVMECAQLVIDISVPCDTTLIGQTLCTEANIYPDSLCLTPEPAYSGAFIEVTAECQDSFVYFQLQNTGTAATTGDLYYVVIEDAVLYMSEPFDLDEGEALSIPVPANGATYHLFAEQEPGVIGNTQIGAGIEGCGQNEDGEISLHFLNQFPNTDYEPAFDIDCRNVVSSYDPNEKLAFPGGYGPQHLLPPNTPLDYLIHFQNTGNDTAFVVVLRDTLSQYLDPLSVRPINSSHPYSFDFATTENGQTVLEFTLDPILLPDSTTNERASHGFVKFKVDQKTDLPIGTVIENRVGIHFDINAPVITNTVWHTIGEQYIVVSLDEPTSDQQMLIAVAPNPVMHTALIQLEDQQQTHGAFLLYDLNGKLLYQQPFANGIIPFSREGLPAGMYHFKVMNQMGLQLGLGKLVVQ